MSASITINMKNRVSYILVFFLTLISAGCSDVMNVKEYGYISMEYDGTDLIADASEDSTSSQFFLRNYSFSYYIRACFPEGKMSLNLLISSGEEFELFKWYDLPTAASENVWESSARLVYDKYYYSYKDDKNAVSGKVRFTDFEQKGNLNYWGEGYCSITGEFEITFEDNTSDNTIKIRNGKFHIPESKYWDSRLMED